MLSGRVNWWVAIQAGSEGDGSDASIIMISSVSAVWPGIYDGCLEDRCLEDGCYS